MTGLCLVPGMPRPFQDELLYSVVARAKKYLGHWSPKALNRAVYSKASVVACADFPSSLNFLEGLAQGNWGMTIEEVALKHTLVGYYTYHRGQQCQQEVINAMRGLSAYLQVRLGICAGAVLGPRRFRLCADCVAEDMQRRGETFWRRSHHLPGVLVCARHGVPLMETVVSFRPFTRHTHVSAQPTLLESARPLTVASESLAMAQSIAAASADLLDQPAPPPDTSGGWRTALAALGFAGKHGSLLRFQEAFVVCFGEAFLGSLFRTPKASTRWLEDVTRKPRRPLHPLKQILLQVFVDHMHRARGSTDAQDENHKSAPLKTWGLYRSPALRQQAEHLAAQGLSTRRIAHALNIDWKTAERLLAPMAHPPAADIGRTNADRAAWLALADAHPDKTRQQLRQNASALYARLYRKDRKWLLESGPQRVTSKSGGSARVDWPKRDAALAAALRTEATTLVTMHPLVRVTRHRLTSKLQRTALVAHCGAQLPLTTRVLEDVCESVEEFQIRRLAEVIQREGPGDSFLPSMVLRRARINQTRCTDDGKALIEKAIRRAKIKPSGRAA